MLHSRALRSHQVNISVLSVSEYEHQRQVVLHFTNTLTTLINFFFFKTLKAESRLPFRNLAPSQPTVQLSH